VEFGLKKVVIFHMLGVLSSQSHDFLLKIVTFAMGVIFPVLFALRSSLLVPESIDVLLQMLCFPVVICDCLAESVVFENLLGEFFP
jgi:hypothetical protein